MVERKYNFIFPIATDKTVIECSFKSQPKKHYDSMICDTHLKAYSDHEKKNVIYSNDSAMPLYIQNSNESDTLGSFHLESNESRSRACWRMFQALQSKFDIDESYKPRWLVARIPDQPQPLVQPNRLFGIA